MEKLFRSINRFVETVLVIIFALLVADVLWQVFGRYVLNASPSFTEEFARFALIWLSVLGAAYLSGQKAHLAMDFLLQKLNEEDKKARLKIIEGFVLVFALVVMVIGGGNLVYTTLLLGQLSPAMSISLGLVYIIIPISGLLMIFYALYHILHSD